MRSSRGLALLLGAWIPLLLCACGAHGGRVMSGAEIEALFADQTVRGHHEKKGYDFVSYYEPLLESGGRGTFRSYQGGAKEPRRGSWWVEADLICIRWQDEPRVYRRHMVTNDRGKYWKVLVKERGKRIRIVTFRSFTRGNVGNR